MIPSHVPIEIDSLVSFAMFLSLYHYEDFVFTPEKSRASQMGSMTQPQRLVYHELDHTTSRPVNCVCYQTLTLSEASLRLFAKQTAFIRATDIKTENILQ